MAAVGISAPADAHPWTRDPGNYYTKAGLNTFFSSEYVDPTGARITGSNYASVAPSVYAEVGVGKGLHVLTYLPFILSRNRFASINTDYATLGFGDTLVGLQYSPTPAKKVPWSLRLDAKLPIYDNRLLTQPSLPALGDGQVDTTGWFSMGGGNAKFFGFVDLGYQFRSDWTFSQTLAAGYASGPRLFGQLGAQVGPERFITLNVNGTGAVGEFADNSKQLLSTGVSVFWSLNSNLALEANVDRIVLAKAASFGTSVGFGVSFRDRPEN